MTSDNLQDKVDITFIGAGPTGLFGAFYAGLRGLSVKLIDALPQPGGQLRALYPEKTILDVPGFPAVKADNLVGELQKQALQWNPILCLEERALGLSPLHNAVGCDDPLCWEIQTDRAIHPTRAVVITAGIGAFEPIRLDIPSLKKYEGRGVDYFIQDVDAYSGARVLVVGGGDSAVDWATNLSRTAEHVTLIHRRDGFRAFESSVRDLYASPVDIKTHYELKAIHGSDHIESVTISQNKTGEEETLQMDRIYLALGFKANLGALKNWGLETTNQRYIKVNARMETNLEGVYAAGDIALEEDQDPLNLIVTGFSEAAVAVNHAYARLVEEGSVFPGHTSSRAVPL
ncbi:MAG: NAD(P)/FAD-dependent oxidoreductase [Anaerolineales bacterium]|nr:NAD(P)/FAD-dependent oxidoreductase [Anaerolineales bacterium]